MQTFLIIIAASIFGLLYFFCMSKIINFLLLRGKPATASTLWMNGACASVLLVNDFKINRIFGGVKRMPIPFATLRMLNTDWGIQNRADAIATIEELTSPEGMHNAELLAIAHEFQADRLSEADFLSQFPEPLDDRKRGFLQTVYRAHQRFGDNALAAWDYGRAIFLYGQCYVCGYLSYEDALQSALALCQRIQKLYGSWDEFNESYMNGVRFWIYGADDSCLNRIDQRAKQLERLKNAPDSPFQLPWHQELKRDW